MNFKIVIFFLSAFAATVNCDILTDLFDYVLVPIIIFTMCFKITFKSSFSCNIYYTPELAQAKSYVQNVQNLFTYLNDNNITVTDDQPASGFFFAIVDMLDNQTYKTYLDSDTTVALTKLVLNKLGLSNPPQNADFKPLLKLKTGCFKSFFSEFCVSNADYSCAGRNLR